MKFIAALYALAFLSAVAHVASRCTSSVIDSRLYDSLRRLVLSAYTELKLTDTILDTELTEYFLMRDAASCARMPRDVNGCKFSTAAN